MAAPFKTGLNSFQLDVNFFADDRIEALSGEFGVFGELAAVKLLCSIYRNGYFIEWSELHKRKLVRSLPGIELQTLDAIIEQMIEYGFFDRGMYDNYGILTSVEIQENYLSATRRRKNIQLEYSLINGSNNEVKEDKCKHNANINGVNVDNNSINVCNNSVNDDNNAVNADINPVSENLPDSTEQSESVARKVNITAIDVVDSDNTLELFNNSNASNNIYQEKEKIEKKEKEVGLALPYCSAEFVSTWEQLRKMPKWRNKPKSALQMSLKKLSKYPEEFAIYLMENSIAGNYQGVVFTWTPDAYRKWEAERHGIPLQSGNKKPKDIYESNMESMNEAFRLIDEKYGT